MTPSRFTSVCLLLVAAIAQPTLLSAQTPMQLAGTWTLNRQLSQFPTDIGFSVDFLGALGPDAGPVGGNRGGGGGNRGGLGSPRIVRETEEGSQRISTLTDEVRNPFDHLTIAVTPTDVTITPDRAPARTLRTDGRDDTVPLGRVTSVANTTWDAGRLVVVYKADTGRQLRYVYSLNASPRQLIVDVEFVERGGGDKVRRVYDPMTANDTRATPAMVPAPAPAAATGAPAAPAVPPVPATSASAPIDQRPDAPLKGLAKLGLVLEDLSGDAVACGLKQNALETTISKHLSDAGFRVVRNSDDDTYMYVNINTAKLSTGLCVSRYDVTIYSHAAARLPHTASPVLLQVELLHNGGLAGGAPAAHADGVTKGVLEYVDQFSNRIRNAGK